MLLSQPKGKPQRTPEQIREHYEVERELADRLRSAPAADRQRLYSELYSELYRRVKHHPRTQRAYSPAQAAANVREKMLLLQRFLKPDLRFIEVGAGDCSLSIEVAGHVRHSIGLDVARQIPAGAKLPENFELVILENGSRFPMSDGSADLVYSNQLMEHIHPQDAEEQMGEIFRVLAPNGRYICITPNQADGPHDVSRYFDEVATCFHLVEYRARQLAGLMREAGFRDVQAYGCQMGHFFRVPVSAIHLCESILLSLPYKLRKQVAALPGARNLVFLTMVGIK